jgi:glucose-fructose oxidoreductase
MQQQPSRRTFLTSVTASVAAATVLSGTAGAQPTGSPGAAGVSEVTPGRKLGFAFVGLGGYATRQLMPSVAECKHVRIAGLVSGTPEKLERFGGQYQVPERSRYSYETMDRLADNPDVDVVYVVTPTGLHAEQTVRALKAGKHVICEKPMASTEAECRQMIDAAKAANRRLFIGYRIHTEPMNLEAIRIVRAKEFGALRQISSDYGFPVGDPNSWRLDKKLGGGGALYDIGIYGVNACRYLTGEEPTEVTATTYTPPNDPRFTRVEEHCNYTLKFPSGVLATGSSSYGYASQNRYRCVFTGGVLEAEPATGYGGNRLSIVRRGQRQERKITEVNQFATQMDAQARAILGLGEVTSTGEEGLKDIRILEAIYRAAATGQTVKL